MNGKKYNERYYRVSDNQYMMSEPNKLGAEWLLWS